MVLAFPRGSNLVKSSQDDRHVAAEERETLNINVEGKKLKAKSSEVRTGAIAPLLAGDFFHVFKHYFWSDF